MRRRSQVLELSTSLLILFWSGSVATAGVTESGMKELLQTFGDSVRITPFTIILTSAQINRIRASSGSGWPSDTLTWFVCRADDSTSGYGIIDEVRGKTQMITYIVMIDPAGLIRDIGILVYREPYGGEVAHESFRHQFRGKGIADDLRPGRGIRNISGATISARAVTLGVKRTVATFNLIKDNLP